jgi:beta-glucanase (GH16 family)
MTNFATIILFILFVGCGKDEEGPTPPEATIAVAPTELATDYTAGSNIINISSNAAWQITSNANWCKVVPNTGTAGTVAVTVTTTENTSTLQEREATLTIKSGSTIKNYNVKQGIFIEPIAFGDNSFKTYCLANFDKNGDGIISKAEAKSVTSINIQGLGITNTSELSNFTSLLTLNCSNNAITTLDLSKLNKLITLNCANNQLTQLTIEGNINLTSLDCSGNTSLTTVTVWNGFSATASFIKPAAALFEEAQIPAPTGYSLVWQDEFNSARANGAKPLLPNSLFWWYETGSHGWGNNEIQNYVAAYKGTDTCAMVYDGTLKIEMKKVGSEVLSARMNTSKNWTYGYFEARLKLPKGKGTWPAFWMMPKNFTAWPLDGEIDIMEEVGYRPNYIHSSVHTQSYYHSIGTQKTAEKYIATAQTDFHIYAVEWTEDFIKGYVDGVNYFTFTNDKTGNYNTWPFFNPFYLKLNLAWGGNWGGAQGVDESFLPATFEIDYVRVFQKN